MISRFLLQLKLLGCKQRISKSCCLSFPGGWHWKVMFLGTKGLTFVVACHFAGISLWLLHVAVDF